MTDALIELLQLAGSEERARSIVASIGTPQSAQMFERVAAIAYANELLKRGRTRSYIASLLVSRYGISPASAYRRIDVAEDSDERSLPSQHAGSVEKWPPQHQDFT